MMTPETLTPEQRAAALEAAAEIAEAHQDWVFAKALREQAQAVIEHKKDCNGRASD